MAPGLVGAVLAVSAALGAGAPPNAVGDVAQVVVGSSVGSHGGCVLKRDGTVHCWAGPNMVLAFDKGRDEPMPGPWQVPALRGVKRLVDTRERTCALLRGGEVLCFLGRLPPEQVTGGVVELAAGTEHLCTRSDDGSISCQGENVGCQLGEPSPEGGCTSRDFSVSPVPGVPHAAGLAAGARASCAVTSAGAAWCWGDHPWRGPSVDVASFHASAVPSEVKFPAPVRRLALASGLACALMEGGKVECARRGDDRGEKAVRTTLHLPPVADLAVSHDYALFATTAGAVWEWGAGPSGVYEYTEGDADAETRRRFAAPPVRVRGIDDAVQVSAGDTNACARTRKGFARCWGGNQYGELGDGTLQSRTTPSWLVQFGPDALPEPKVQPFSCSATLELRRSCLREGDECTLEPPPAYWVWGGHKGTRMTDEEVAEAQEELKQRPMPPCLCSCSPAFQKEQQEWEERQRHDQRIPGAAPALPPAPPPPPGAAPSRDRPTPPGRPPGRPPEPGPSKSDRAGT